MNSSGSTTKKTETKNLDWEGNCEAAQEPIAQASLMYKKQRQTDSLVTVVAGRGLIVTAAAAAAAAQTWLARLDMFCKQRAARGGTVGKRRKVA